MIGQCNDATAKFTESLSWCEQETDAVAIGGDLYRQVVRASELDPKSYLLIIVVNVKALVRVDENLVFLFALPLSLLLSRDRLTNETWIAESPHEYWFGQFFEAPKRSREANLDSTCVLTNAHEPLQHMCSKRASLT